MYIKHKFSEFRKGGWDNYQHLSGDHKIWANVSVRSEKAAYVFDT